MIEIEEIEGGWHKLIVGGKTVIGSFDPGICKRMARILSECRNMQPRAAIRRLMDEIGYDEEDNAKYVYSLLFDAPTQKAPTLQ